jgi:hypothetical protein
MALRSSPTLIVQNADLCQDFVWDSFCAGPRAEYYLQGFLSRYLTSNNAYSVQLNKALEGLVSQPLFLKFIRTDWVQIDIIPQYLVRARAPVR